MPHGQLPPGGDVHGGHYQGVPKAGKQIRGDSLRVTVGRQFSQFRMQTRTHVQLQDKPNRQGITPNRQRIKPNRQKPGWNEQDTSRTGTDLNKTYQPKLNSNRKHAVVDMTSRTDNKSGKKDTGRKHAEGQHQNQHKTVNRSRSVESVGNTTGYRNITHLEQKRYVTNEIQNTLHNGEE